MEELKLWWAIRLFFRYRVGLIDVYGLGVVLRKCFCKCVRICRDGVFRVEGLFMELMIF